MEGLVSVIIPVYNSERFIGRCIKSILNQTYNNIEIIVIYDESPDNTFKILKEFKKDIYLIKQSKKTSPAIAMNRGLARAEGEYIAFCGSDDFFAPEKIKKQVEFFKNHPNIGLTYTDAYIVNEKGNIVKYYRCPEWDRKKWLHNHYIVASSVLIRREILEKVGLYHDESLKTCEDLELFIRLSKITNFKRIPEFLTYYTIHNKNLSREKIYMFDIDRIRIYYKHKLLLPLIHSLFVLFRNQVIIKTPIVNTTYRKISRKVKKRHFWEDEYENPPNRTNPNRRNDKLSYTCIKK